MAEYIDREAAIASLCCDCSATGDCRPGERCADYMRLKSIPAADVVSKGAYDQCDWERVVALTQLKEIGKGLGERMDDVRPVVSADWKEIGARQKRFACSNCKALNEKPSRFCPSCGAEMMEES